jgi:hypothetical protein
VHGAGSFLVENRRIGALVSPTKVGRVVQKLRDVRLVLSLAEVGWSSTKGTRDSRAATARSPASRRRKVPREWSLPRFLDHQAGWMSSFLIYAGSSPAISFACAPQKSGAGQRRHHEAGRRWWPGFGCRPNPVPGVAVVVGSGVGGPRQAFIEAYPWNIRGNLIPPTAPFGGAGGVEVSK